MNSEKTITFQWRTGKIVVSAYGLLDCSAAELKKLVNTATENAEEVKAEIRAMILEEIENLPNSGSYNSKAAIEKYKKLLSAVEGKKQTVQEKIAAKIIKSMTRDCYKGIMKDAGKYCVCDGYRLLRFSAPLSGFDSARENLNTEKLIADKSKYSVLLSLPELKELKADIKLAKSGNTSVNHVHVIRYGKKISVYYDFGYGLPMVDALFLCDMLEALPDCKAYNMPGSKTNCIYFVSGDNDGILLPVKKAREFENPPVEESAEEVFEETVEVSAETAAEEAAEDCSAVLSAEEEQERIERAEREDREQYFKAAEERIVALMNTVSISAEDIEQNKIVLRQFKRGFIIEEEAKKLILYPIDSYWNFALPAPTGKAEEIESADPVKNDPVVNMEEEIETENIQESIQAAAEITVILLPEAVSAVSDVSVCPVLLSAFCSSGAISGELSEEVSEALRASGISSRLVTVKPVVCSVSDPVISVYKDAPPGRLKAVSVAFCFSAALYSILFDSGGKHDSMIL